MTYHNAAAETAGESEIFIGRQPILDAEQRLFGYELLFRSSARTDVAGVADDVQATSRLVINTFNNFGVERVLGDRKAFINVSEGLLLDDAIELLPVDKVVLEILESVSPTAAVVQRCYALKAKGYQLALDDFSYRAEFEPLFPCASYIKLDLRALGMLGLAEALRRVRGRGPSLIAEKVETREQLDVCRAQSVQFFQGYYFAKPETLTMRRLDPSTQLLMQLFGMVTSHADPKTIEVAFRQDVALSYNLLRFINSAGFGLVHKVQGIRHALVVLGHAKLARWLTLLMYSTANQSSAPHALFRTALTRARLAELVGRQHLPPTDHDYLFLCGMFSMLDAMLGMPLEESLRHLSLPEPVTAALLRGEGRYAPYLALGRACEQDDPMALKAAAAKVGARPDDVARAQIEAIGWSEEVARAAGG
jgi:EAL and modified HD-GYP domain-containing signal transduction protein